MQPENRHSERMPVDVERLFAKAMELLYSDTKKARLKMSVPDRHLMIAAMDTVKTEVMPQLLTTRPDQTGKFNNVFLAEDFLGKLVVIEIAKHADGEAMDRIYKGCDKLFVDISKNEYQELRAKAEENTRR